MQPNNFDREKLDLEKEKFSKDVQFKEAELKLKEDEFNLKKKELNRYKLTPARATIIAAFLGILGIIGGNYLKYIFEQKPAPEEPVSFISPVDTTAPDARENIPPEVYTNHTTLVYICDSKSAGVYHRTTGCSSFSHCKGEIKRVSLKQALAMSRRPCRFEY
jgi:hypothetical protein